MKTINVLNTKKFSPYQIKSYLAILEILGAFYSCTNQTRMFQKFTIPESELHKNIPIIEQFRRLYSLKHYKNVI